MAETELHPHTFLEDLPGNLVLDIAKTLTEDGSWYLMAKNLKNFSGDHVFSEGEILHMKRNPFPGKVLLNKLIQHDLQVQSLQYLLKEHQLYDILRKVITNVPAQIWPAVGDGCHSIRLGEKATITLDIDGSPYPECQWYFKDCILREQTSCILTIDNFSINNQGEYKCKVQQNLKGELIELTSPTFILQVERMPPKILEDLSDVEIEAGAELVLTCGVVGYPVPQNCRWYKNDKLITTTSEPTLEIPKVDSQVSGSYSCEVWNDLGSCTSRLARVKVIPCHFASVVPVDSRRPELKLPNSQHRTENFTARNKWALLVANATYEEVPLQTPRMDMKILAQKLRKLQFRCMLYSNLKKADFSSAVHLFSEFLQKGDYVVFYYAGHGFHKNGIDFLMPLDTGCEYYHTNENIRTNSLPRQSDCISATRIYNIFQRTSPALLFSVYDTCRDHLCPKQESFTFVDTYQDAQANSCTLFATSEACSAFEGENRKSLLMEHLADKVENPIPVDALVQQVRMSFHSVALQPQYKQIPKTTSDLAKERSLVDPAIPNEIDSTENGALNVWERMASVGGVIEENLQVADLELKMNIECHQEKLSSHLQSKKDYPAWIISNRIDIVITITQDGRPFDPSAINGGVDLDIMLNTGKKIPIIKLRGKTSPIIYPVADIQTLEGDLLLQLVFFNRGILQWHKEFNLGMPSVSKRFKSNILT